MKIKANQNKSLKEGKTQRKWLIGSMLLSSVLFVGVFIFIISSRYFIAYKVTFAFFTIVIFSNVLSKFVMRVYHKPESRGGYEGYAAYEGDKA